MLKPLESRIFITSFKFLLRKSRQHSTSLQQFTTKLTTLQLQQTPTTTQPETLPNPRTHPSHGKSIKTRWENIRKYFAKKIHSQLGHFLSKELHYLIPHLKSSPPVAPKKRPVVTNERPVKTVNDVFHEEDEETLTLDDVMNTTKNIKEASTSTMNSTSTVQFQTENQKQERIKKVQEQQFSKKIIPPKDINYIKNADKLNMLEKKVCKLLRKPWKGFKV
ncbi:uncharacterized protein LOC100679499 isoform X1 [Nasonia vitripennis]|uniref:Uncharacterized protein n=1 Tax=Nasonia vitripennis TaxID=7425 RepID=A0A7M7IKM9_NASVI|nr:uncharacterized protein LOC100679499 isoform X1 [Nasonia vitripennis]XP_016836892.2 uncharacterized protein LOC100679499 isoform X1 [Nasonia vitripennis]XP_016836893.2 uncharacterized protein LOC100679499 isoform X1 [Nasonia vitripennis]XP_016836894.2 uncharacterized protein LOC100679499 isoform X1 [Nasonia vitripennis]